MSYPWTTPDSVGNRFKPKREFYAARGVGFYQIPEHDLEDAAQCFIDLEQFVSERLVFVVLEQCAYLDCDPETGQLHDRTRCDVVAYTTGEVFGSYDCIFAAVEEVLRLEPPDDDWIIVHQERKQPESYENEVTARVIWDPPDFVEDIRKSSRSIS